MVVLGHGDQRKEGFGESCAACGDQSFNER